MENHNAISVSNIKLKCINKYNYFYRFWRSFISIYNIIYATLKIVIIVISCIIQLSLLSEIRTAVKLIYFFYFSRGINKTMWLNTIRCVIPLLYAVLSTLICEAFYFNVITLRVRSKSPLDWKCIKSYVYKFFSLSSLKIL